MSKDDLVSGFLQEIRRGTVVLCVLAKLAQPQYGYNLVADLAESGISIEANTLYPLLRRLEAQKLLESAWNTDAAKPRKYYATTNFGKDVLAELTTHWHSTMQSMNKILEEKIQ